MGTYDQIKTQISFAITGAQTIVCPSCDKQATARTSGIKKIEGRRARFVRTSCRHCGTIYSFIWR